MFRSKEKILGAGNLKSTVAREVISFSASNFQTRNFVFRNSKF